MSEPFIFIGTHRIKEGKLEDFKKDFQELSELVESNEPRVIAFNAYIDDEGTEVAIVQVHPDADSMEFHMQVVREHIERAYREFLDATTSLQVFGKLSDAALEMMRQASGVSPSVKPSHVGGFTRSSAG